MPTEVPRQLLSLRYHEAAQEYLRSLPRKHFLEATPQATQREITLESLALVRAWRSDVHVYNELLVQYAKPRRKKPRQVVPDNMVVVHAGELKAEGSYDVPLQPARPFWMLEYVSRNTRRKDYDDNMQKYERELKVPYYLLFQPDVLELTLYRHNGTKYVSVKPNENDRYAIAELELEVALLDGWVRYWFRGELLPLPAELLRQVQTATRRAEEAERQRDQAERQLGQAERQRDQAERLLEKERADREAIAAELARLKQELEGQKRGRNNHR
jgi:Uma2 family endonuclease